jgi:hypothetical protein
MMLRQVASQITALVAHGVRLRRSGCGAEGSARANIDTDKAVLAGAMPDVDGMRLPFRNRDVIAQSLHQLDLQSRT